MIIRDKDNHSLVIESEHGSGQYHGQMEISCGWIHTFPDVDLC
jgi:hypothetical protein